MKFLKGALVTIMAVLLIGCAGENKSNAIEDYYNDVEKMVTDKGYTLEEVSSLKANQKVKKIYDNAVLERFGKIQGYSYKVTYKWNDGLIEGPITDVRTEYSILPLKEFKKQYKDSYEDSMHFSKYTIKEDGYIILDTYYSPSVGDERYYILDGEESSNGEQCESYLSAEQVTYIKQLSDSAAIKTVSVSNITKDAVQLKLPEIAEKK